MRPLEQQLRDGAQELGLDLSPSQSNTLLDYLDLLLKWNKTYNLTAVRSADEMLSLHLLDSLAVVGPLRRHIAESPFDRPRVLDVGSGAGLPGVVLAVCCPGFSVVCVDAVGKKAAFIQQVAMNLKLPNLRGVHARVEDLPERFEIVVSRAFASLHRFTDLSSPALAPNGAWLAMKGKRPDEGLSALPENVRVFHVEPLTVPGLDAQRCLVWMRRADA